MTGNKATFTSVDSETYTSFFPSPMGLEMLENHLFIEKPGYYAGRSLEESRELLKSVGLKPTTWEEYLVRNKDLFKS